MNISKNSWNSIFGWYHTGDFVIENLNLLKRGPLEKQLEALQNIELEIEHQGGLSYLAPFAVQELVTLTNTQDVLVKHRIEEFLEELHEVIIAYFSLFDDTMICNAKKKDYSFQSLFNFFSKYPDESGKNSIWETEDDEGLLIVYIVTKKLIDNYKNDLN